MDMEMEERGGEAAPKSRPAFMIGHERYHYAAEQIFVSQNGAPLSLGRLNPDYKERGV